MGVPPSDSSWRSASTLEGLSATSLGDQGTVLPKMGIRPVPGAMAIITEPSSRHAVQGMRQPATMLLESRLFLSFEGAAHECSSQSMSQSLVPQELLQRCLHSTLSPTSWAASHQPPVLLRLETQHCNLSFVFTQPSVFFLEDFDSEPTWVSRMRSPDPNYTRNDTYSK